MTGTTVFVFNAPRYALGLPFAPAARDDDGWLDVIVFRKPGPFQALYYLWKVFWGTHLTDSGVFHRRAKRVEVTSQHRIPVQIDGDPGGYLPAQTAADPAAGWTVEVIPAALDVIAPAGRRPRPTRSFARQRRCRAIRSCDLCGYRRQGRDSRRHQHSCGTC